MRGPISALCSALLLLSLSFEVSAQRVVQFDIWKPTTSPPTKLRSRATFSESILNNVTGGSYMIRTSIGTPPQSISLVLDTGSSDVWVLADNSDQCSSVALQEEYGYCSGGTFSAASSSTYRLVNNDFDISYADGSESTGDYFTDTFALSNGNSISQQQMGLALKTTVGRGIMGTGYNTNEATKNVYPSVIDNMVSQGLISTKAYSLWLNDLGASTGSILFGGIDTAKYHGTLIALPLQRSSRSGLINTFTVALSSVSATVSSTTRTLTSGSTYPVVLDSGTTLTYLPGSLALSIFNAFGVITDRSGNAFIDCAYAASSDSLNYSFGGSGGPTIQVPLNELVFDVGITAQDFRGGRAPFTNTCIFGLASSGSSGINLLGDTFLRSAYVVYDISNNQVALAPTNFNATDSNVVEIPASATGIPLVSGVASSASAAATGTDRPGIGGVRTSSTSASAGVAPTSGSASGSTRAPTSAGGNPTLTVTVTPGATGAATSSSGAAASRVSAPGFDFAALAVLGTAGLCAVLGGGWFAAL